MEELLWENPEENAKSGFAIQVINHQTIKSHVKHVKQRMGWISELFDFSDDLLEFIKSKCESLKKLKLATLPTCSKYWKYQKIYEANLRNQMQIHKKPLMSQSHVLNFRKQQSYSAKLFQIIKWKNCQRKSQKMKGKVIWL